MDLSFTFTLREIIRGMITLLMYEFIFRPVIVEPGIKRTEKEQKREKKDHDTESLYNPKH